MAGLVAACRGPRALLLHPDALKLVWFGYVGQELAHVVTGENRFVVSTYQFKTLS